LATGTTLPQGNSANRLAGAAPLHCSVNSPTWASWVRIVASWVLKELTVALQLP